MLQVLQAEAQRQGLGVLALVGGAVRDALLHHEHRDPWRGLPDLDLVVEGSSERLAHGLRQQLGPERVSELRVHGRFGTVEMVVDGVLLDLAQARQERYPAPGENPVVEPGPLPQDLARRDFSVNAMALLLSDGSLLDPHGGRQHLAQRQLAFLHPSSVADDPTRVIRAARYAARLGFSLAPQALDQLQRTLQAWPWRWRLGDDPASAPPALATRLRMELELLLEREAWAAALSQLQAWGALVLLDPALQQHPRALQRRLRWAARLQLPLLCALVAAADAPLELAARLQLPQQQQRWLEELGAFQAWLMEQVLPEAWQGWSPARWCEALEARPWPSEVVALAVSQQGPCWRPLLRWWGRWRHVTPPRSARELMATGLQPGPALGEALRRLRLQRLEAMR
ncbi:tRNA nucleotidyltransferase/poly(A) polymerase [Synechococcus sp. RS9917]|nr:tRNA nucleotidyltransferase/poly(A) polymerase [Synechococcus sp. RS9917]